MNQALEQVKNLRIQRTMQALEANNMKAYYLERADQVADFVRELLPQGAVVSNGGSMTLAETGLMELLGSGHYSFLDRTKVTGDELDRLYRQVFSADWYLTSANAITEEGQLFNVDGNANRVAALTFGPKNVLVVAGCNKIVADLAAAQARVKAIAAPANTLRLGCKTPCATTGKCEDCHSPGRICCTTTIHGYQRLPGRIQVLLVGESLGY